MSQNGQTHGGKTAIFLNYAWPFWDVMRQRVKFSKSEVNDPIKYFKSNDESQFNPFSQH